MRFRRIWDKFPISHEDQVATAFILFHNTASETKQPMKRNSLHPTHSSLEQRQIAYMNTSPFHVLQKNETNSTRCASQNATVN
jgi:hypothetical protein